MVLFDDAPKIVNDCMYCFVYLNSLYWTLVWLAPGDTQDSDIVRFYVLFQTIGQMVTTGPTDPYKNVD